MNTNLRESGNSKPLKNASFYEICILVEPSLLLGDSLTSIHLQKFLRQRNTLENTKKKKSLYEHWWLYHLQSQKNVHPNLHQHCNRRPQHHGSDTVTHKAHRQYVRGTEIHCVCVCGFCSFFFMK